MSRPERPISRHLAGLVAATLGLTAACFTCPPDRLQPGDLVERSFAGPEPHVYRIDLRKSSHARFWVEQRGIDVTLYVDGPDGELLGSRDSPTTAFGPESFSMIAPVAGTFRLRIQTPPGTLGAGHYTLRFFDSGAPKPSDRTRIRAEEIFQEAGRLHWDGSIESLTLAHRLYGQAIELFAATNEARLAAWARLNRGELTPEIASPRPSLSELELARAELERLGDPYGELEASAAIAFLHEVLGHKQRALVLWRQVLDRRVGHGDQRGVAHAWHNIAAIYESLGETTAAREHYERALSVMDGAGDRYGGPIR